MRAEVMPKPDLPGHAVLRVHELDASPDGLAICIERRQGPEKYLSDGGWQRSESWLAPERIERFGGGIDFHVGPIVCDMVAGLTVRLSIREPGVGNVGATVVAWPSMQTSGAYDPNRMVAPDAPAGTDRGFATGSAPTTVARLPEGSQIVFSPGVGPPPGQPFPPTQPPPPFQQSPEPPPLFESAAEPPPPFQFDPAPPPFGAAPGPMAMPPPLHAPAADRIGGVAARRSSAAMWIVLGTVVVLLLSGVGAGAWWWFGGCDWCRVAGTPMPPKPPEPDGKPQIPQQSERVLADEYLRTRPAADQMVEKCRALRADSRHVAAFLVCKAAADAGDPVGAAEYAAYFDPVNRAPNSPIDPDAAQAARWYERAAKVELPLAMRRLGQLYAKGADNFPADTAKAKEWLTKAADKGDSEAKKALAELQ